MKPLLKILIGIFILLFFLHFGIPFEFKNPTIESIFSIFSFSLIFFLIYILFKKVRLFKIRVLRILTFALLSFLSFLFLIGTYWNNVWVSEKNERNTWKNLEIHENQSGTKILRQVRKTSGSIFDYRDRLVLYEFDKNNRISINTSIDFFNGPWKVIDLRVNR